MRVRTIRWLAISFTLLATTGLLFWPADRARAEQVTVFAAASLQDVIRQVGDDWSGRTGHQITIVPAGSATLARQIQLGAPADVFISANVTWMNVLAVDDLIVPESRIDLARNRLVLISHDQKFKGAGFSEHASLPEWLGDGHLAMALVNAVPAGIYGKAALQHLGLWAGVQARVAQTDNVRAALMLVRRKEARFGIVYATDARARDVVTVGMFPARSHPQIVYPAALLREGQSAVAGQFLRYLQSTDAQQVFIEHGFGVVN